MKSIVLLTALVGATAIAAPQQPDSCFHMGAFKGKGSFIVRKDQNQSNLEYDVEGSISNDVYDVRYRWPQGEERVFFKVRCEGPSGFFEVIDHSTEVVTGSGYCVGSTCHYSTVIGGGRVEETITYHKGQFIKTGSKVDQGGRFAWSETLEVVE